MCCKRDEDETGLSSHHCGERYRGGDEGAVKAQGRKGLVVGLHMQELTQFLQGAIR